MDFENTFIDVHLASLKGVLYNFLFFAFAYYAIAIPVLLIAKKSSTIKTGAFWIKSLALLTGIGFCNGYYLFPEWISNLDDYSVYVFFYHISNSLKGLVFYLAPIFVVRYFYDQKDKSLYGLLQKNISYKPYWQLLLIISPVIIIASLQPAFLIKYPFFKPWEIKGLSKMAPWQMSALYEITYAIRFVLLEWMFRGALVIGMVRILGKDAVLPMVAAYTFLHFGKPLPEAVAAVIGGYVLGIIALRTRSVAGGCIIHVGIALLMDLMAIVIHYIAHYES